MSNDLATIIREALSHTRGFDVRIFRDKDGSEREAYVVGSGFKWTAGFDHTPNWESCWTLTVCTVNNVPASREDLLRAIEEELS